MKNLIVCTDHLIQSGRRLRWAGHVARMEEGRSAFKMLTGSSTGWEDSIRIDLKK